MQFKYKVKNIEKTGSSTSFFFPDVDDELYNEIPQPQKRLIVWVYPFSEDDDSLSQINDEEGGFAEEF